MNQQLKANLTSSSTWQRGLFMLLFAVLWSLAEIILTAVALFQFGSRLLTGSVNRRLLNFAQGLATYIYQIALYVTFRSDERPYPFEVWPKGAPKANAKRAPVRKKAAAAESEEASSPEAEGGPEGTS
jgi:hypothetical protein